MTHRNRHHTPLSSRLRRQARHVHPVVADAYRRRASELEFESWLRRLSAPAPFEAAQP